MELSKLTQKKALADARRAAGLKRKKRVERSLRSDVFKLWMKKADFSGNIWVRRGQRVCLALFDMTGCPISQGRCLNLDNVERIFNRRNPYMRLCEGGRGYRKAWLEKRGKAVFEDVDELWKTLQDIVLKMKKISWKRQKP